MTTAVIVIAGVFFLGMGVYALVAPAALVRPFRIVAGTPESRSEIRAVYGGFGVAIAAVLAAAALDVGGIRTGAVITVGAALAGMALGRVLSRLADAATPFYPVWFYFWVEVVTAALLFSVA
ncbi:DUF4345 domain-containing protein [Lentzea sp. BCCO 10_0856]|uniref:DUF4345 domain-containing protein n=1 Tax=Lentzea miocenica TaxID=3095431 RepID=A0ABU4SRT6_9PSEU|nr:DUF4345 domain-containing protein [Lentzea sp. BCCO 10_0856]MDX8028573.1 DUF4345 domain-containing protein [Lentzea sp. BCCO 10_0856]